MKHIHLTALTMLLVATGGTAIAAQAQTPPSSDSVAKDSVAPKKSRFGSLRDRAKAVAGNKTVQKIANNETVKGAAMGVACTVVPGAAVVSAATGQGPCANSGLMAGLMNGRGMAGLGA